MLAYIYHTWILWVINGIVFEVCDLGSDLFTFVWEWSLIWSDIVLGENRFQNDGLPNKSYIQWYTICVDTYVMIKVGVMYVAANNCQIETMVVCFDWLRFQKDQWGPSKIHRFSNTHRIRNEGINRVEILQEWPFLSRKKFTSESHPTVEYHRIP